MYEYWIYRSFRSKVRAILSTVLQNQHRTLKGSRASSLAIRPSSRTDERGREAIKDGRREEEGGERGYLSRRLDSRSRSWILSPGTPTFLRRKREGESWTKQWNHCVSNLFPFSPPSRHCRRILTNKITRRQGVPLFSLFLFFPSIRYSKRPTVTDTTAMIHPGRPLDISPRDYAESRRRRLFPFSSARFFVPLLARDRTNDRLVRSPSGKEDGALQNKVHIHLVMKIME